MVGISPFAIAAKQNGKVVKVADKSSILWKKLGLMWLVYVGIVFLVGFCGLFDGVSWDSMVVLCEFNGGLMEVPCRYV